MIPKLNLLEKLRSQKEKDHQFYQNIDFSNLFEHPTKKEANSTLEFRLKNLDYSAINLIDADQLKLGEVYHIDSIRK